MVQLTLMLLVLAAEDPDMTQGAPVTTRTAPLSENVMIPMEKFTSPKAQVIAGAGEMTYVPVGSKLVQADVS